MCYLHDHYDQIRSIAHSPVSKKPTEEEEQQLKDAEEELETTRNPIVARKAQEYIDLCALQLPMAGLQVHHISCGLMHTVCSAGECGCCCFARVPLTHAHAICCGRCVTVLFVFGIMSPRFTLFNLV